MLGVEKKHGSFFLVLKMKPFFEQFVQLFMWMQPVSKLVTAPEGSWIFRLISNEKSTEQHLCPNSKSEGHIKLCWKEQLYAYRRLKPSSVEYTENWIGGLECWGKTKTLSMIYFISGSIGGIPINNNHRTRSSQNLEDVPCCWEVINEVMILRFKGHSSNKKTCPENGMAINFGWVSWRTRDTFLNGIWKVDFLNEWWISR